MNTKSLKILLVEDDEDDAFYIKDLIVEGDLNPRPIIKHALNPQKALELLNSETFDICIFDYSLGEMHGIDLLKIVRKNGCNLPIIFLTGQGDQDIAVEAMKSGATDYRTKNNLTSESLFQSIRFAMQLHKEEELRKAAEARLKQTNEKIKAANRELQVSMKKLQTAQNQILQAEKLASIGRLAAGVCHELLNPLNIISGHVQALMMERVKDAALSGDLNSIMEEIGRIEKIVGGLLKFSRKEEVELKHTDINTEIESVLMIMEREMNLDNIQVVRKYDKNLPKIKLDADRMRQVFLNLINNARHAMERGGILTVTTEKITKQPKQNRRASDPKQSGPGEHLRISFQDTGTGIRKEDMVKLFDPFFTTKPEDKGTGLGLSVCYTIIEKHGGTIEVESEYGKGAKFIIELPLNFKSKSTPASEDPNSVTA